MKPSKESEESKNENSSKNLYAYALGFSIPAAVAILTYLGSRLDQKLGGGIFWTSVGIFLGAFYCCYEIWKLIKQNNDKKDKIS